ARCHCRGCGQGRTGQAGEGAEGRRDSRTSPETDSGTVGAQGEGGGPVKANEAQGSESWALARVGMFTASRAADLMARTRSGPSAPRGNLLALLAVERLTGQPVEGYRNAAMERGIELEAEARDAYSFATGDAVAEAGFVVCPDLPNTGCSPDGFVGA